MATRPKTLKHRPAKVRKFKREKPPSEDRSIPARRLRASTAWRKMSETIRRTEPLCADPYGHHAARPVPSAEVHHIVPLRVAPELAFEPTNLVALCVACHAEVEIYGMPEP